MPEEEKKIMDSTLLSTVDCAARKGVTRQAIFLAIQRGDLPAMRIGGIYLIKPEDCENYDPAITFADRGRRSAGVPRRRSQKAEQPEEPQED